MNKVKKKVYRNTTSFNMMAWASFAFFVILMLVGQPFILGIMIIILRRRLSLKSWHDLRRKKIKDKKRFK